MQTGVTQVEGGSGMHSLDEDMPDVLPERFEAGTLPTPAAAGLREGIRFVRRIGTDVIRKEEEALWRTAYGRLAEMHGVRLYDHTPGSVLLFNIDGLPPAVVGERLDRQGICVRCGYHCAPMAHTVLGTVRDGGVRASFCIMNTQQDMLRFTDAVFAIEREAKNGV